MTHSFESAFCCQNVKLKIFDHKERHIYTLKFPAKNPVSIFGLYPWELHDKYDIRVVNKYSGGIAAVVRKQWSYFCKEKCSNGGNYFVKFR
jgi:hypothetical protein